MSTFSQSHTHTDTTTKQESWDTKCEKLNIGATRVAESCKIIHNIRKYGIEKVKIITYW